MKNVFLYLIKAVASMYFVIFIVAAIDIVAAMLTNKTESLILGFRADLFSLLLTLITLIGLSFIISIPVKPKKPTN